MTDFPPREPCSTLPVQGTPAQTAPPLDENALDQIESSIQELDDRLDRLVRQGDTSDRSLREIEKKATHTFETARWQVAQAIEVFEKVQNSPKRAEASSSLEETQVESNPGLDSTGDDPADLDHTRDTLLNVLRKKVDLEVQNRYLSEENEDLRRQVKSAEEIDRDREAQLSRLQTYRAWLLQTRESNQALRTQVTSFRQRIEETLEDIVHHRTELERMRNRVLLSQDHRTRVLSRLHLLEKRLGVPGDFGREEEVRPIGSIKPETARRLTHHFGHLFDMRQGYPLLDSAHLQAIVRKILSSLKLDPGSSIDLAYYTDNAYLRHHTFNVTKLAMHLGIARGYSDPVLEILGISALLHDLGMAEIAGEIVDRPTTLTHQEREQLRKHPAFGELIFKDLSTDSDLFATVVSTVMREHHERSDGSGYPDGKTSGDLHELSKIVSIADTYEAITAPRAHRIGCNPHESMKKLIGETGQGKFDEDLVKVFLRCMSLYPIGSYVLLSSQQIAKVVAASPRSVTNPIVRVVQQADGSKARFPLYIDLSNRDDVSVTGPYDP